MLRITSMIPCPRVRLTILILTTILALAPPPPASAAAGAQAQQPAPAPAPAQPRAAGAREAASVHDIYERARSSVVLLIGYDANNQPLALGSGFFVKSDIIATNMHVIEGASSVKAKYMSGDVATITTISGIDPDHDVVLLESPVHQLELPLQLSSPDVGEPIVVIGNPRGLEGTVSTGIVSGIRRDKSDTYYQITAPISPGSSGGPVIDQGGQVIGISTFTLTQGQNLNFAAPAIYVDHLLAAPRKIALSARIQLSEPRVVVLGHENVRVIDPYISGNVDDTLEASVFNGTDNTIKSVRIIAILHKGSVGGPIVDYINLEVSDNILPHLSKRFSHHDSNLDGHGDDRFGLTQGYIKGRWFAEFRVLDYEIIKDSAGDLGIPR
jgi:S1-C subfamily serine protease